MVNPPQDSTNFAYQIPYQSNTFNPNNNQFWSFPPSAVASDPTLHPPGTGPYANPSSYSWTHVELQAQTSFGSNPNDGTQNWAANQAEPIRYEASMESVRQGFLVPTASSYLWNSNWADQALPNNAIVNNVQPTKVMQSIRCDVCNVFCNSKDMYEAHVSGKKHQKKVRMQYNPSAVVFPGTSNAQDNISLTGQTSSVGGQEMVGSSGVAVGAELKRKKPKGSSADSVRVCTVCNAACDTQEVFEKHLAGKRHKAQATIMALPGGSYIAAVRSQFNGKRKKNPNKIKLAQSAWCEVCKINCNSSDSYIKHQTGKKHQKNLEQQGKLKNDSSFSAPNVPSAATNEIIGPMENPGAKSQASEEDLETKKRKIISAGAAADVLRMCTVCNVVCNSQTVFISHLAGQKHAAMVKKQAEAGVGIRPPQSMTAS